MVAHAYNEMISTGTEVSRNLNKAFGDKTGRTITKTVMDGAGQLTNGKVKMNGLEAHSLMWLALFGLISRNRTLLIIGVIVFFLLVFLYFLGRI